MCRLAPVSCVRGLSLWGRYSLTHKATYGSKKAWAIKYSKMLAQKLGNKIFENASQKTWAIKYSKAGARLKFQFSFGNYAWKTLHQLSQLRIYDKDKRD